MKFFRLILVAFLVFTSCKTKSIAVSKTNVTKKMSARKVSKKHIATFLNKRTIDAKMNVAYKDEKQKHKLKVKLRIETDKVIWINVTYKGLVLLARAKITPTSVSYYEKINRTYFKGDFKLLEKMFGAEVNFKQLQSMLIGETIFDLKMQRYKSVVDNDAHLLLPVQQKTLFDILFWINPNHFKLDMQALQNSPKKQELKVAYKSYSTIDGEVFPKKIEIRAKDNGKFTNLDIDYRSVIFNKNISIPFRVPRGYKQVVF
jgi:hypothetical protein